MSFMNLRSLCTLPIRTLLGRRMATQSPAKVTRLSKHLELHQYHPETLDSGEPRPILVFLPWSTATQSLANRYRELYATRGFNVLTVWGNLSYFLWPQWAGPMASELADYLNTQTKGPLVIHSMSIGAYFYSVTLSHIKDRQDMYTNMISRVKGQVYDSIVIGTLEEMAIGVGIIVAPKHAFLQRLVTRICLFYFAATKQHTVVPYNRVIDAVFNSPMKTPKLCLYSLSDALCRPEAMRRLISHWRGEYNLHIIDKAWENSPHASHLKYDPEAYHAYLDDFLAVIELSKLSCQLQSKL